MEAFMEMLAGTPTWVWVLLVFLVIRGIKSSRTGVAQLWRLAIIPGIFTVMGLYSLFVTLEFTAFSFFSWLITAAIGIAFGYAITRHVVVRADRDKGLIEIPGSWLTLVLILCIFASKYALSYQLEMDPEIVGNEGYIFIDAAVSGVIAGLFFGRFFTYWDKYRKAPNESLSG